MNVQRVYLSPSLIGNTRKENNAGVHKRGILFFYTFENIKCEI